MSSRARTTLALVAGLIALLALPTLAAAGPKPKAPDLTTAQVQIGRVTLASTGPNGGATLLVPVHYPTAFAGRVVRIKVGLRRRGIELPLYTVSIPVRVGAGPPQAPVGERRFTFVHGIRLRPSLARRVRSGELRVRVHAGGIVDVNEDGVPELRSSDHLDAATASTGPGNGRLCSSLPRRHLLPGRALSLPLPDCTATVRWRVRRQPDHGHAEVRHGRLFVRAGRSRGTEAIELAGTPVGTGSISAAAATPIPAYAQVSVGTAQTAVVRAIGDSVTAGFGYYDNGRPMPLLSLYECKPGEGTYVDACSSNSAVTSDSAKVLEYAPDYGLANNVSWAAQWANANGITNYENLAVSGSEPKDWAPGGQLHATTARVEAEDPDYVLITIGANPLLSDLLFGAENMGCAIDSDILGGFAECIERNFREVALRTHLKALYSDLVENTSATIYLMQYPTTIPSSALAYTSTQIAETGALLNREIASVAAEVSPGRLQVIAPPHFNVGISIAPVYPSTYTCGYFEYPVDGPSVQSNPTQDELEGLHYLSFCPGPVPKGPPWVISGDTGIHPSAAGYFAMRSALPAPR